MTLEAAWSIDIRKPPHDIFEAIVDPAKMANYFISSGSDRLEAGKTITWRWADVGAELAVEVKTVEPDRRLVFTWQATGVDTLVTITLTPIDSTTTAVEVTERGWDLDEEGAALYGQQTGGWADMLLCLKAYLIHGINLRA
jgi:uncharacterized protein YndB with AHSA1/START domain